MSYKRTYKQLLEFASRLTSDPTLIESVGLPRAMRFLAEKAFMESWPDDEDTKLLRHQINALVNEGKFDITSELE